MKRSVCFFTLALFLLNLLFFSCSKEQQNPRIYLDDSIYWAVCDEGDDGSYGINSSTCLVKVLYIFI